MLTTHFVSNGPLQTAYFDLPAEQPGDTLPFLLVHGFTGSKLDFSNQLHWFRGRRRVLAYDQRGHGESSNQGPYTLYTLIADLINFLDTLGISRCHILGHSLGGMVVMRALLAHAERFCSAILMDTAPYPPGLIPANIRAQLNDIVVTEGCEGLLAGMRGQAQSKAVQRGINHLGEMEHWRRIRVKLSQMDPAAFVQLGEILDNHPSVLDTLRQAATPTTIIVGAEDTPFLQPSWEMAAAMPDADLTVIENAGHSPQYENHLAWRDAVEAHLGKQK